MPITLIMLVVVLILILGPTLVVVRSHLAAQQSGWRAAAEAVLVLLAGILFFGWYGVSVALVYWMLRTEWLDKKKDAQAHAIADKAAPQDGIG